VVECAGIRGWITGSKGESGEVAAKVGEPGFQYWWGD